jgi:hypothetical protein
MVSHGRAKKDDKEDGAPVLSEAVSRKEDGMYSRQHSIFFFLNIVKTDNDVNHFLNHL